MNDEIDPLNCSTCPPAPAAKTTPPSEEWKKFKMAVEKQKAARADLAMKQLAELEKILEQFKN